MSIGTDLPTVAVVAPGPSAPRPELVRRARLLARLGLAWHGVEAAVAVAAGIAASSIALVGFGADSLIEAGAGGAGLWRFGGARAGSQRAERRAQVAIAASFLLLAAYVAVESLRTLAGGDHPDAS